MQKFTLDDAGCLKGVVAGLVFGLLWFVGLTFFY